MQGVAHIQQFFSQKKVTEAKKSSTAQKSDPILLEISQVTQKLRNIKLRFDFETEHDMIDSCIYEERALLSRYRHLLSIAKQKGLSCSPTLHYEIGRQKNL